MRAMELELFKEEPITHRTESALGALMLLKLLAELSLNEDFLERFVSSYHSRFIEISEEVLEMISSDQVELKAAKNGSVGPGVLPNVFPEALGIFLERSDFSFESLVETKRKF